MCNYTESDGPTLQEMCALGPTGDKIIIASTNQIRSIPLFYSKFSVAPDLALLLLTGRDIVLPYAKAYA
jgi:hypothetical protein